MWQEWPANLPARTPPRPEAAAGRLRPRPLQGTLARGEGRTNFETFFAALGPAYDRLQRGGLDAYSVFRCGMAHEYFVKARQP